MSQQYWLWPPARPQKTGRQEIFWLGTNLYKAETRNTCRIQTDIPSDRLKITCKGRPVEFKLLPCPELEGNVSLIEFETEAGTATSVLNL